MKIGIAFSGGGTRAFAHLGALKALEEAGIRPSVVSGASAGSIVGAFTAAGLRSEEILALVKDNKFIDYATVTVPSTGFFKLSNLSRLLERLLPAKTFSELNIPFFAAATNLYSGKIEYFSEGPLVPAIEASCSIPVIFSPVVIKGQLYVDGGVLNNLPVAPLKGKCDKIIALSVGASGKIKRVGNLKEAGLRAFDLLSSKDSESARKSADLFLEPEGLGAYKILDTTHADELFKLGYENAKKANLSCIYFTPACRDRP